MATTTRRFSSQPAAPTERTVRRGRFITFEGGEGSGKTTQIAKARAFLAARGRLLDRDGGCHARHRS